MKKILAFLLLAAITITGCSKRAEVSSDKPQIYCSFYGIYDFASKIAGDKADVHNMVPTGTEPHDWEPSTKDMASLTKADIVFYNGLGMEGWIDKVKASVGNNVKFVELSQGIESDENSDPHIWLNPQNALKIAENIKDTLCESDLVYKDYYESNFYELEIKLNELDNQFKTELQNKKDNKIVVAHEAYSYLCDAYGLEQTAIEGVSAEGEPSPSKMQEIIKYIKDNNIKYIFFEELVSPKVAKSLADETGCELLVLNPFEGLTDEEIADGKDYISIMRENLDNLKIALGVE
ncbi:MAG: metal ABC transporter substrate-binding protein [Lachnospirales bacterium]